jgi:1,4-dihydroxy-6-naphthoate synthase
MSRRAHASPAPARAADGPDDRPLLTLAHSPDPDDVFMWWPVTGMVDPRDPARLLRPPGIDTGRFRFRSIPEDIDALNRRAIAAADLDITAVSIAAYPALAARYALTRCGSSMGLGYGPKVVARAESTLSSADLASRLRDGRATIAVPGVRTTAFLVFSLMVAARVSPADHPAAGPIPDRQVIEMPFDRIVHAVVSGRADAGLLIHQSQLTFNAMGLRQVADVGAWWFDRTGLPLPLGGNAIRRDLDDRFGPGTCREIAATLRRSIEHALAHRDLSVRYAMGFAPEIDRAQAERYIDLYVNRFTLDAGSDGLQAIRRLLDEAAAAGLPAAGSWTGVLDIIDPA